MATVVATVEWVGKRTAKVTWTNLTNTNNVGDGQDFTKFSKVTFQSKGTFGGATINIEGSNDAGTTYHVLNDSRGEANALAFTAADTRSLNESPQLVRPAISGGAGTTVTVIAVATRE